MCPALERYEREAFQELHPFEIIPGTDNNLDPSAFPRVFHVLAIKVRLLVLFVFVCVCVCVCVYANACLVTENCLQFVTTHHRLAPLSLA
jgi:hypothetical protein